MKVDKSLNVITRRDFLKAGSMIFGGALVFKFTNLFRPILKRMAQTNVKHIYIAPDDHTDYFWTADETTYRQAFIEMIDYYLNLADSTNNNRPEHQSRWNCDGNFWMWTYEKNKTPAEFQRLISRIRDGHISAPLNALVSCHGGTPVEAVIRGMYYAGQLERRYTLRFNLAVAMENQTLPYGLGAIWAGSGAKYSWRGICGCATKVPNPGDREHDIYWWVGPDDSKILMKWNSMLNKNISMGGYAEAHDPAEVVDYVDTDPNFIARYPYQIIGAFGKGWDNLKTLTNEFVTVAQSKTSANRLVIVSNEQDFFQDFENAYSASLPSLSASFGNEWDLYCASMAEVSARVKRAVEKLRGAEALATMVVLENPGFMNGREGQRDLAWIDLGLYWEHNWTADGPISRDTRRDWQRRLTVEIETYVDKLQTDAAAALSGMIQKSGSNTRFFAFNPLGWARSAIAEIPFTTLNPVHVLDLTTGQEIPSQIVTVEGERRLQILASDVPSVGYKVFEIVPGAGQIFPNAATINGNIIENQYFRITVADRGAITSLIDKSRTNREFARSIGGRFINDLGPSSGLLQTENSGPVSVTLMATAPAPLDHSTRITIIRDSNSIEIQNDIHQNLNTVNTWSFGFELNNPDLWHEEVGAVIRARLLSQGGHYSPRNARYDWLTLNHFADISGDGVGITLSNADCYFMKLGNSTADILDVTVPQISPLVGGQVDGPTWGIPNQGGDTNFLQRFALRPHDAFDSVAAMMFALEHQNPLITGLVTGGTSYPEKTFSLLTISSPDVLIWALKPAEDGIANGIVVRFWNLTASPKSYTLSMTRGSIKFAQRLTHIETPIEPAVISNGALSETIAQNQIQTFSINTINPAPTPTCTPVKTATISTTFTDTPQSGATEPTIGTAAPMFTPQPSVTNRPRTSGNGCIFFPMIRKKDQLP